MENASGDYVAFIDDDEFATERWLISLFQTCEKLGVTGVLGPVKAHFESEAPGWAVRGGFFERPNHETGFPIGLSDARTGNVLFRREILKANWPPFREQFGTGGEDVDFFKRMMAQGARFVWCAEAEVYEIGRAHV